MKGILAVAVITALSLTCPAQAQQPKPLFAASDPLRITIEAPFARLTRSRNSDASVSGTLTGGGGAALPVALSLRGITRRTKDVCDFPPLSVQFTAPPPASSPFAGQKKLKLVTHCRNSASFQQYVLLEYAAYRMYNLLTPRSFRVRLANIDYVENGRPLTSRVGYFIEPLKDVAARNGMPVTHAPQRISLASVSRTDGARYALFQDMIANHDWSMRAGPPGKVCCHNAELIGSLAAGSTVPIPYDFDYSGLVNAPYALPPEELKIGSVRSRAYRGYCAHNAEVLTVARQMRDARPQMLATLAATPGLDPRSAGKAAAFLDGFFADIADDQAVSSRLLNRCVN